jgi:hypothetical protein
VPQSDSIRAGSRGPSRQDASGSLSGSGEHAGPGACQQPSAKVEVGSRAAAGTQAPGLPLTLSRLCHVQLEGPAPRQPPRCRWQPPSPHCCWWRQWPAPLANRLRLAGELCSPASLLSGKFPAGQPGMVHAHWHLSRQVVFQATRGNQLSPKETALCSNLVARVIHVWS